MNSQETIKMPWSVQQTIEDLKLIKAHYQEVVRAANRDGKGEQDVEEVAFDFDRAIAALEKMENAVDSGYLEDWYINSVSQDDEPVWTESHIEELCNDFILIPKAVKK
ncbi:MAG: hypothetical protein LUG99_00310 [Lachnospiraceae bacterium]|nr:hypothetical protein [Lachnospiraceae bacterium]